MYGVGDQFLAGAGFASDQDGCVAGGNLLDAVGGIGGLMGSAKSFLT